jgi:hypothetical protein
LKPGAYNTKRSHFTSAVDIGAVARSAITNTIPIAYSWKSALAQRADERPQHDAAPSALKRHDSDINIK